VAASPWAPSNSWRSDVTDAFDRLPDQLPPVAPNTGPFPHRAFLSAVERAALVDSAETIPVDGPTGGAILVAEGGTVRFAGPEDLTDYHSPLGDVRDLLEETFSGLSGLPFRFDSMPTEACDVVVSALTATSASFAVSEHEATAVLDLPETFDDWLASIGKKERHEVRRKRRRFEAEFGAIEIERMGADGISEFSTMHRSSEGEKGTFMTDEMEAFFFDLLETAGASIHNLVCGGKIRASAFGFETPNGYFYYNSAYDRDAAMASPGVVLFSSLIELQIDRGATVFDFLKGQEPYKYRYGAVARPLYVAEGTFT